jgi:DnaJ-class molecular chaperone
MELAFEDLFKECKRCSGEGMLNEVGRPASTMTVESTSNLTTCPDCDGKGGRCTPTGDVLRRFFKHLRQQGEI